jgi:predicted metal-dependent phosphoesterase TrpH
MAAPPLLLGISGAGAGLKAYGQWKAAEAQADAKREQAQLKMLQAGEVLKRNQIKNDLLEQEAIRFSGTQAASMAASGGGVSATSSAILEETARLAGEQAQRNSRAAEWEAFALNKEAESMMRSADQFETAGKLQAIGSLLGSAGSMKSATGSLG